VRIPGPASQGEGGGIFVLAIPLDSGFAVETGLAFIEGLESRETGREILIAFLGDEKVSLPGGIPSDGYKGLEDLLSLCEMPETWILCYLDAVEAPSEIVISHGSGDYIAPLQIVKPLAALFLSRGISSSFEIRYNEIYKLGLAEENRVLSLAWEAEINGVRLSGVYGRGDSGGPIEAGDLADTLLEYQGALGSFPQSPDRHYSIIPFFGEPPLFISGRAMVLSFVSLSALWVFSFLLFSVLRRERMIRNLKQFFPCSWITLILLPLPAAIIKGAGFVYSLLLFLFKASPPSADYFGIGSIVLLALLLFSLASWVIKISPLPGKAAFFGFSAALLVIPGAFTALVTDFAFLPVFIWASFFTFLGVLLKNPGLVFFSALLVPFRGLMVFFDVPEATGGKLAELLLSGRSGWMSVFQFAAFVLPPALLVERAVYLFSAGGDRGSGKKLPAGKLNLFSRKNSLILRLALLGIVVFLMVIRVLLIPPA
jgi:hypothetical protein